MTSRGNPDCQIMKRLLPIVTTLVLGAGAATLVRAASPSPAVACPSCDDYNFCTTDSCDATTGTCRHDALNCDDGNPCTIDSCEPTNNTYPIGGCRHAFVAANGICDDGNSCTLGDACDGSGHCIGETQQPGSVCDDRNACTTGDACDDGGSCRGVAAPLGSSCDDGNLCTSGDLCAPGFDRGIDCQGVPRNCGDDNACTTDACDPSTGQCLNPAVNCNDGNACTTDSCDPATGSCQRASASGACDDGNFCTTNDSCSGGNCLGGAPNPCSDGISCTQDRCIQEAPFCRHSPDASLCGSIDSECLFYVCDQFRGCQIQSRIGTLCHAGSLCQVGRCTSFGCQIEINLCNDGNPCTSDTCVDPAIGTCGHANLNGAACNDGNACTTGDVCLNGACQGAGTGCDDGNACTVDTCTATGCGHAPLSCDDGNACTTDACDPLHGCQRANTTDPCDDGNACTTGDRCGGGSCQAGGPASCDDGDPCTFDACDATTGCSHTPQSSPACPEEVVGLTITRTSPLGKGSGTLLWSTSREFSVSGFNVIEYDQQGNRIQVNSGLVDCHECVTGLGGSYSFIIPKHKSARGLFVELVHRDGRTEIFGPATKQ